MRRKFEALYYSFPIQLFILHVRRNLMLVAIWVLFVTIITQNFGRVFGVPYLFLDPEYLNVVGFWSFFLVGVAFGGMAAAFHITCYILYGHKYTFVGILEKPFIKFSINNSVLPLIVFVIYVINIISFQVRNEYTDFWDLVLMLMGFSFGIGGMTAFLYAYFSFTNKDIFKFLAGSVDKRLKQVKLNRLNVLNKIKDSRESRFRVDSYLNTKLRAHSTRGLDDFYDKEAVLKVFDQNHFNSVIIEIAAIGLIAVLGLFMDVPLFKIPAAASTLLIFTLLMMISGAISYWFRSWATTVMIVLFVLVNILVKQGILEGRNSAIGLNYEVDPTPYNLSQIEAQTDINVVQEDVVNTIKILENWKSKQPDAKPKAVFLCMSGGGQRSALWTVNVLQRIDSLMHGQLMNQTVLMTGASGGIIGGAYFRELYLRHTKGQIDNYRDPEYLQKIAMDNLNPIIFSLLVNDMFLRSQYFTYNGFEYQKDRGYSFEHQLNLNTDSILDKPLIAYREDEIEANIPMLILSPTIVNDGRKLFISPQNVRYMNVGALEKDQEYKVSGVDFLSLFHEQESQSLRFLNALRMSASFPYITPNVELPTSPIVQIMDAGISDNFGISDALRFIHTFKGWLEQNTSGIVLVSIRDTRKSAPIEPQTRPSILQRISSPISSVYNNLGNIQDINNDNKIQYATEWYAGDLDVISIEYNTYTNIQGETFSSERRLLEDKELERASLSWHLTSREKNNVIRNIDLPVNQASLGQFKRILSRKDTTARN